MGKILIIFKIFPEDPDETEEIEGKIKEKVKSLGEVRETRIEPIAFGLKIIKAAIVIPDKVEGVSDKIEAELKKIKGISNIEIEGMTLI